MSTDNSHSILVVDDEPEVADAYALRLQTQGYDVETAYGGEAAIEEVSDEVGVMLLDRRMPMSGDETLQRIREEGYDVRVIMVTAVVNPDFDIIDMPFDDYLCKPVDKDDLINAIEQQLDAVNYDDSMDEYFRISSKIGVLEAEKSPDELEDSEEYQRLKRKAAEMETDLSEQQEGFNDMMTAFNDIERGST
jgi:DNA-binding response OmpR family regulator